MRRWFLGLFAVMVVAGALVAPPASAGETPIGSLGDPLRVRRRAISSPT